MEPQRRPAQPTPTEPVAAAAATAVKQVAKQAATAAAAQAPTPASAPADAAAAAGQAATAVVNRVANTVAKTVKQTGNILKGKPKAAGRLVAAVVADAAPLVHSVVENVASRGRRATSVAAQVATKLGKHVVDKTVIRPAMATGAVIRSASQGLRAAAGRVASAARRAASKAMEVLQNPEEVPEFGRRRQPAAPGRRAVAKSPEAESKSRTPPREPARFNKALQRANSFDVPLRPPNPKYPRIDVDLPRQPRNWRGIQDNEKEMFAEIDRKAKVRNASINARKGRKTGGNKALRKKLELSSPILPYDHLANDGYYIKY